MISKPNLCNMKQGWEIKKLGEVCEVAAGQGAPQGDANYCKNGIPFVKAGNLESLINGISEYDIQNVSDEVAKRHRLKLYKAGSVVFAKSGMSCMKGYVYALKTDCYVVSHLAILTPYAITTSFLQYTLRFHRPNNLVKDNAYPSISLEDIKTLPIPVPPLAEQERIVEELECLSGVIEKKKQQLKELDALAQSIFYEMFGDPITNEKGWEVKKLGDLCKTTSGGTPSKGHDEYYNGGSIPWLRSGEVNKLYIYDTELFITEEGLRKSSAKWFPEDTVVIAMYGATVGQVGILKNKMTTNQAICGIFPNEYFTPVFLYHFLLSKKKDYLKLAAGGAQPNISQNIIKDTLIPLPPLTLQQAFASKIEAIEKQKELIKQSIKEVETLFNSKMDYYFN